MSTVGGQLGGNAAAGRLAVDQHLRSIAREFAALEPGNMAAVRKLVRGLPTNASLAEGVTAATACDAPVPSTWLIPKNPDPTRRLVFCHGLSFMAGDLSTYGGFVSRLAVAAQASTLLVHYRLAPEHHFPAAHDDCLAALLWAQRNGPEGTREAPCAILGDSCGASLAIASALAASRARTPAAALILFAPFANLSVAGESWNRNHGRDPILTTDLARGAAALYAPGVNSVELRLSPILDDLTSLPPTQIHASAADPAFDDAVQLAERARRASVRVECHFWDDVPHSWCFFHDELYEARQSAEMAGSFVKRS